MWVYSRDYKINYNENDAENEKKDDIDLTCIGLGLEITANIVNIKRVSL